ncbi:MAG: glycoside hydrolase family 9 protein [Oscillospiraceae bacterium]|nr:glycoside hydrolase family 9 protein [Oscillospiraceae bacterium]
MMMQAAADAGEDPGKVDDKDKVFPDPASFSYDDVEVNFAKALQYSIYFYDANKCGTRTGNLEWRGDCHMEDAAIPLKHWETGMGAPIGVNVSDEWVAEHLDILDPDGDGCLNCEGGMHDAGDHVKFGLPGSYAASTLGWGYYEFRDAYEKTGQAEHIEQILHAFCDFYLNAIYYNEDGSVLAYVYQVGEGNCDHNYWIAPELQNTNLLDFGRPAYLATVDTPASDMCAGTAAALAVSYLNFKDTEPEFAEECLKGAYALYEFAVDTHSEQIGEDGKPNVMKVTSLGYDGGFYTSSYDYDELAWAAVWLYECTVDKDPAKQQEAYDKYIDAIIHVDETVSGDMGAHPYTGYMKRIIADTGNCWQNIWVHCWDTVWGGVFAKLAPITNISRDWYIFRWNLEFWSGMTPEDAAAATGLEPAVTAHKKFGTDDVVWNTTITPEEIKDLPDTDGAWLKKTPAGFGMLNDYGSARYDTAFQLCALVYAKETGDMTFADWAEGQMEYIMGKNPMNRPYIVGYSDTAVSHPHHRAAHGSLDLNMDHPEDQTHVLWGALAGGPDAIDWHRDLTKDYIYNEVAVDYNAAFVGACAGLYSFYGTSDMKPVSNFPPAESTTKTDEELLEFTLKAAVGQEDNMATQVLIELCNQTQRPPRYLEDIKVRYYFDISEVLKNGGSVEDITVRPDYDQMKSDTDGKYVVSYEIVQYNDEGGCYLELTWPDYEFYGTLQYQFALMDTVQNAEYTFVWDPSNDYSRSKLKTATEIGVPLNVAPQYTDGLTMYAEGELVWGVAPEDAPDQPEVEKSAAYGDVDCNEEVNILDAVMLARLVVEDTATGVTDQGKLNADCKKDGKTTSADLTALLKYLSGLIPYTTLGT